jgi:hypothetical protein
MAQLPRYEEVGVRVGQPTPAATIAAEARAKAAGTLADGLNRLSNFAFEEANKQAKVEGLEFGVLNAPTPDQMRQAMATGQPVPMVGDTYSTFGRSAREGALYAMQTNIEVEARDKIAELHVTAQKNDMDPTAYQKELQNIIGGYGEAMGQVSPQTAYAVRAKLSSMASTQFVNYSDAHLKRQTEKQKIMVQTGVDRLIANVDQEFKAGDKINEGPDGTVLSPLSARLDAARAEIVKYTTAIRDPGMMQTKLKAFDDAVTAAQTSFVATWSHSAEGVPTRDKYMQLMKGKIEPTPDLQGQRVARLWDGMTPEHRAKALDEVRRQWTAAIDLDSKLDATAERQRKETQANTRISFLNAWANKETTSQTSALQRMQELHDVEGFEKYSKLVRDSGASTESGIMFTLERELAQGTLTADRVGGLVSTQRLSFDDARSLLPKIEQANDASMKEGISFVKNALGYPDKPLSSLDPAQKKAEQLVHQIHNEMIIKKAQAVQAETSFNAYEYAVKRTAEEVAKGPGEFKVNTAGRQIDNLRKDFKMPDATLEEIKVELAHRVATEPKTKWNPGKTKMYQDAIKLLEEHGPKQ